MTEESNEVKNADFAAVSDTSAVASEEQAAPSSIDLVSEIPVKVSAELGHTSLPIREILGLGPGSVIELNRLAGESIDLLVNGVLVGRGDVVIVNENFAIRITEIVNPKERLSSLAE